MLSTVVAFTSITVASPSTSATPYCFGSALGLVWPSSIPICALVFMELLATAKTVYTAASTVFNGAKGVRDKIKLVRNSCVL